MSYRKDESLVDIRRSGKEISYDIIERVANLEDKLNRNDRGTLGLSEYRWSIVKQACELILRGDGFKGHVSDEIVKIGEDTLPRYLFYRFRYETFPKKRIIDDFPPCLQVEPTSVCNYRCVFCYQSNSHFTSSKNGFMGMMSLDLFKKVVDQAYGEIEAFTLASRGEPLLCKDITKMIRYAAYKFLGFKINTNAWYLTEDIANEILNADVNTLVFSADAASEPLYGKLRVGGNLDRITKNIEMFQRVRAKNHSKSRIITRVSGVKYPHKYKGQQRLGDMEKYWGGLVDQVAFVDYIPWENVYERTLNDISEPCSDLWRRMFVWFDGSVNPCDVDFKSKLQIGDVNNQTLSEIWLSKRYGRLRDAHLNAMRIAATPCRSCSVI